MSLTGDLINTVKLTKATKLIPKSFFIAWRGVLTLAFTGFPSEIVDLKQRITTDFGNKLPNENPGSKWPKMSLAALKENAKPLTQEQVDQVTAICEQMSANLALLEDDFLVDKISYVVFGCRSLEKLVVCGHVNLDGDAKLNSVIVADDQKDVVANVLAEAENKEEYLKEIQKLGNREKHYTEDHMESTLAVFLGANPDVVLILQEFQRAIDYILPGYYHWFKHEALHCTLRCV
ncbi:UNVERIFIED_CONTAM: hypothetical protein HDU68_010361 [Siphonaria sp. JEL0065]|nr:hypothetical protein HDU68_010361 [Siphonaria sp. JEL0065]